MSLSPVDAMPSLIMLGLTRVPLQIDRDTLKRWVSSTENAPRTAHTPQRFSSPKQHLEKMPSNLDHHSNCCAHSGAVHSTVSLALKVSEEHAHRLTRGHASDNAMALAKTLIDNLRARAEAEHDVGVAQEKHDEMQKRHWLQTVVEKRAEAHAKRFHQSRDAHMLLYDASERGVSLERRKRDDSRRHAFRLARAWKHVPIEPQIGPPPYHVAPKRVGDAPRQTTVLSPREGGVGSIQVLSPLVFDLLAVNTSLLRQS